MSDQTRDGEVMTSLEALNEQSLAVSLETAAIDQMIATAHKYPRSLDTVIKKISTMACYNEAAAENCVYSLPRGGKPIIGPSIGFANIVATAWGNCADASRWVTTDRKEKVVVAEGVFHDYETNRKTIISEQRRIVNKNGGLFTDDMIIVTSKAAGAIARRNAILQIVPRTVWFPLWEQALHIVRGNVETFSERKDAALKAFAQFGVKPEQVFTYIGIKGEADLTLEHIPTLRGMYGALRDGSITVEEMFDPRRASGTGFARVANPMGDDHDADDHDNSTGEVRPDADDEPPAQGGNAPQQAQQQTAADKPTTTKDKATAKATTKPKPPATAKAAAKPAATEPATTSPAATDEVKPTNSAEYMAHITAWAAGATSETAIDEQWKAERGLRGDCSIIEEDFERARKIKDARIAELKKGG